MTSTTKDAGAGAEGITVLFATHNGARTLPRMFAALERLERPRRRWTILAVDNGSTDETRRLLEGASARLPLTILSCPTPGKLPAQQLGARAADGDLIIFTDDDVEPVPGWLVAYEAAADAAPEAGLFGGPIIPVPLEPLTEWFEASASHHAEMFARTEFADERIDPERQLFGGNFMLRRGCLDVLYDIPATLGPTFENRGRARFAMGEDTALMGLVKARGVQARGVPDAAVRHLVRRSQTELPFMLQRAERHGRGWAIVHIAAGGFSLRRRLATCARMLPGLLSAEPKAAAAEPATFNRLWQAHWRRGAFLGALVGPFPKDETRTTGPLDRRAGGDAGHEERA